MNCGLPDVEDRFRKSIGTRDQVAYIRWIIKKARELEKNIYFCFIDYANFSRNGKIRPPYLSPEKSVCRSRSNS